MRHLTGARAGANCISKLRLSQGSKWDEPGHRQYSEESFEKQLFKEPGTRNRDRNPDLKGESASLYSSTVLTHCKSSHSDV
jgi:hypothetical protein